MEQIKEYITTKSNTIINIMHASSSSTSSSSCLCVNVDVTYWLSNNQKERDSLPIVISTSHLFAMSKDLSARSLGIPSPYAKIYSRSPSSNCAQIEFVLKHILKHLLQGGLHPSRIH